MSAINPDAAPPVEPAAPAPADPLASLQGRLQESRKRAQNRETKDFAIPGSDDTLWGTFKVLTDYGDLRAMVLVREEAPTEQDADLYTMCERIVRSCTAVYTLIDGKQRPLDMTIGVKLANTYYSPVDTDRQAVFAIFPDTASIAEFSGDLTIWAEGAGTAADEVVSGNSEATGS